jgi:hypothetical protein
MTTYGVMHHCIDKRAYRTEGEARCRGMYGLMIRKGILDSRLNVYQCKFADHFHVGNRKRKVA